MLNKKALSASAVAVTAADVYVEDVFATHIYNGTGATQTITNGIDLSGQGGMVWIKARSLADQSAVFDTARGVSKSLATNLTSAQYDWAGEGVDQFNSNGFRLDGNNGQFNDSLYIYASWTFRKAAKFFDVVTYTGNGANRTISHNLGSTPGVIIVKSTSLSGTTWMVYHRSLGATKFLRLHLDNGEAILGTAWNNTEPTSTEFTIGTNANVNQSGDTYVAYLFAHDAGGFGDNGDQNVITCGSYTGNGSATGPSISLGYEPQWLLIKNTSSIANWFVFDNMRAIPMNDGGNDSGLLPNRSNAEAKYSNFLNLSATGFNLTTTDAAVNESGSTFIYIAIRRGPMKTPTDATKVFQPVVYTGTNVDNRLIDTTIAPDFVMIRQRNDTVVPGMYTGARLTGSEFLITGSTNAGAADADSFDAQLSASAEYGDNFSSMSGVWVGNDATRKFNANTTSNNHVIHAFKRAPGFFDVVCYTGTGANRTVTHNLGAAPELMIIKARGGAGYNWLVYHSALGNTKYIVLNSTDGENTESTVWNNTSPTSSVFTVGTASAINANTETYLALLFASVSGVSKVGSYTGNGSNQTINCGFSAGARYILIRRTDTTGDWFVYDSARGIVSGNDPQLKLNTTTAEATGYDAIDPDNSGFIVNNNATNFPINVNNATYIYLAIA
jgi:hypothetical protein